MTDNPDSIVSVLHEYCDDLVRLATSTSGKSAYSVEREILGQVIAMGASALALFFETEAACHIDKTTTDAAGRNLKYHGLRSGVYYSIFGAVRFKRSYYWSGGEGTYPMDACVNLPEKGQSDLLRQMTEELALSLSYEGATQFLSQYFPLATSTRCVAEEIVADSRDGAAFYAQLPPPKVHPDASILAVQGDGKGVPMVKRKKSAQIDDPGRPSCEPTRDGRKKEATVVSVSSHLPFLRTPEQVVASLFGEDEKPFAAAESDIGPINPSIRPINKRVWATLTGKDAALAQANTWVKQMDGDHIRARITLTDGSESLQRRVDEMFPGFVRILDLIHAISYLWKAADAQFGGGSNKSRTWARGAVLRMLQGKTVGIIEELDTWLEKIDDRAQSKWKPIETSAGYFEKNLGAMKYDEYLAKGWPIATGIIEGACRHVVKDRCEGSGMRWTEEGAEAMLNLRCIHQNGHWADYHAFRRAQRSHKLHGREMNMETFETDVYVFNTRTQYQDAV